MKKLFGKKMSHNFEEKTGWDKTAENYYHTYKGSPSDLRKVFRHLEEDHNMWSYHKESPIMREGRLYECCVYFGDKTYSATPVKNKTKNRKTKR